MKLVTTLPAVRITIDELIDALDGLVVRPRDPADEKTAGRTLSLYQVQRVRRIADEMERLIRVAKNKP